ncbi:MAG: serine/threonine protein kinase [Planctomycetota bacterium]|nr:MAG: serine/threonine protein kinase [Planctomycetota bacterium]
MEIPLQEKEVLLKPQSYQINHVACKKAEILFGKMVKHLGFLSERKIQKALQLFSQSPHQFHLGEVFIEKEYLTVKQVLDLGDLLNKALRKLHEIIFSKIAVEMAVVPEGYFEENLKNLSDLSRPISQILLEKKLVNPDTYEKIKIHCVERIQSMALENLAIAVIKIIDEIKKSGKPGQVSRDDILGEKAVGLGWISLEDFRKAQAEQVVLEADGFYAPILDILLNKGLLSQEKYHQLITGETPLASPIRGYQVLRKVGQGAMGVVYKAVVTKTNQEVALKILLPKFAKNKDDLARFLRSAHLSANLDHPNLVRTIDVGKCEQFYYQAMEFVRGESVLEYMRRVGPMDEVISLTIVAEVTSALAYLDSQGLVHRDVKPHNIMMTHMGEIKLTDLGIIRDKEGKHMITEEGISIGSPHYISPEQAMGEDVDIRSDLYSLGATLYHMLVGEYPYQGRSGPEILFKQVHEPPPNPRRKRPELSPQTASFIMTMMAKNPNDRFQSPSEVINELRYCLKCLT